MGALAAYFRPEEVSDGLAVRRVQLKIAPKVLVLSLKRFTFSGKAQKIQKRIGYDPLVKLDRTWVAEEADKVPDYFLSALICHHGESVHKGHYTAIVRYNNDWYSYDDQKVVKIAQKSVAEQQASAYLLVYQAPGLVD